MDEMPSAVAAIYGFPAIVFANVLSTELPKLFPALERRYGAAKVAQVEFQWGAIVVQARHEGQRRVASISQDGNVGGEDLSLVSLSAGEISAAEAGRLAGLTSRRVRQLCVERAIGRKVAGRWFLDASLVGELRRAG